MTDERITEIGRLVAELHAEAVASENPYALAKLNSDLAAVGLLRLVAGCFADVAKSTR